MTDPKRPNRLLENEEALRRLSRILEPDPNSAEDLIQETWLVALERSPEDCKNPLAWLSAVMRNLARAGRRDHSRRERIKELARLAENTRASCSDTLFESVRDLVRSELSELREPYQEVVRLRYFKGLTPAEIASRTMRPVATVKSQLQRGSALLRSRMEQRQTQHVSAVLLLAAWASRSRPHLEVAYIRQPSFSAPAVGAAAALMLAWMGWQRASETAAVVSPAESDANPEVAVAKTREGNSAHPERLAGNARTNATQPRRQDALEGSSTIEVLIEDEFGKTISDATVYALTGSHHLRELEARTEGDSKFVTVPNSLKIQPKSPIEPALEVREHEPAIGICVHAPGFVRSNVRFIECDVVQAQHVKFVLSSKERIVSGSLRSESGAPIAGAKIERWDRRSFIGTAEDRRVEVAAPEGTETDHAGRYEIRGLDSSEGLDLRITAPGFVPHRIRESTRTTRVVRDDVLFRGKLIRGCARDSAGRPVAHAEITVPSLGFGNRVYLANESGEFVLEGVPRGGPLRVLVHAPDGRYQEDILWIPRTPEMEWDATLTESQALTVQLVETTDRTPLSNEQVKVVWTQPPSRTATVVTDAKGRFTIEFDPRRSERVEVLRKLDYGFQFSSLPCATFELESSQRRICLPVADSNGSLAMRVHPPAGFHESAVQLRLQVPESQFLRPRRIGENRVIPDIPAGSYGVLLELVGHGVTDLGTHTVTSNTVTDLGQVSLPALGTVEFRARNAEPGSFVRCRPAEEFRGNLSLEAGLGEDRGQLSLLPGWYSASLRNGEVTLEIRRFEVKEFGHSTVEFGTPDSEAANSTERVCKRPHALARQR